MKLSSEGAAIIATSTLRPSGQADRTSPKKAGSGQPMGLSSFFTIPSASAASWPTAIAWEKSWKATMSSTHGQLGDSGISSAVISPVVP